MTPTDTQQKMVDQKLEETYDTKSVVSGTASSVTIVSNSNSVNKPWNKTGQKQKRVSNSPTKNKDKEKPEEAKSKMHFMTPDFFAFLAAGFASPTTSSLVFLTEP